MGTIAVPNTFSPNTTISSSQVNSNFSTIYNEFNGNIAAANLATGAVTTAKIADSNVTTAKIADSNVTTAKINDGAVTPVKRSGGFYIGTVSGSTVLNSTGDKSITGVGFTPKLVTFQALVPSATNQNTVGLGAMTATGQYAVSYGTGSGGSSRNSSSSACIGALSAGASAFTTLASRVSMDADGFTINVSVASGATWDWAFIAYA